MTTKATAPLNTDFLERFRAEAATQNLETLMKVYPVLKAACTRAEALAVMTFAKGDIVTFPLKSGKTAKAKVLKTNTRSVTCEALLENETPERQDLIKKNLAFLSSWNVPARMLTRVG